MSRTKTHSLWQSLSLVAITCQLFAVILSNYSVTISPYSTEQNKYFYENLGIAFLVSFGLLTIVLSVMQKQAYFPFLDKKSIKKLDERQRSIRSTVFEKSYHYFVILNLLLFGLFLDGSSRMNTVLIASATISYFAIPTAVASFRRTA